MCHNLNIDEGKVAFASTQKAWHGLGQIVDNPMTTKEAIILGGLDFEVVKKPIYCDNKKLEDYMTTQRVDTGKIFGVVGSKYQIVQNVEAFNFFDSLSENNVKIETVGALGGGERIFITCKLPHKIVVGHKDDLTEMYVLLSSSHDGSGAIVAGLTPVRVVCQNTLNMALSKSLTNKISIRHTSNAQNRVAQAGQIMRQALMYQTTLEEAYNFLFKTKITDSVAKDLIKKIIQQDKKDSSRIENILTQIETCYNVGIGQEEVIGTGWGLFNGITHYLSHEKNYHTAESKFNSLLLGGESEKTIKKSFDVLMDYAKHS